VDWGAKVATAGPGAERIEEDPQSDEEQVSLLIKPHFAVYLKESPSDEMYPKSDPTFKTYLI
jgi:hypothetical protein